MSDIRVSSQLKKSSVFAGEELECTITITNASRTPRSFSPQPRGNGLGWRPISQDANLLRSNWAEEPFKNFPSTSVAAKHDASVTRGPPPSHAKHKRSISIKSLTGDRGRQGNVEHEQYTYTSQHRGRHGRAASLYLVPQRSGLMSSGPLSAPLESSVDPLPFQFHRASESYTGARQSSSSSSKHAARSAMQIHSHQKGLGSDRSQGASHKKPLASGEHLFSSEFPGVPEMSNVCVSSLSSASRSPIVATKSDSLLPVERLQSPNNLCSTPRSSMDFYSMSNNSSETLASEYVLAEPTPFIRRPTLDHQILRGLEPTRTSLSSKLMMGYVQIVGFFTLDGSLMDQSPFEDVKRRGNLGGQGGGGVVGYENSKRSSGILGGFGWSNIGDSIGSLLGTGEISSIRERTEATDSKSVPIISTPQTIMFIDLQLKPGETKSYTYNYLLPKRLPPTYRGRATKIAYNIVIGIQRIDNTTHQLSIRNTEMPFRVLPYVDAEGELVEHDLTRPYLVPEKKVQGKTLQGCLQETQTSRNAAPRLSDSSSTDFVAYVEDILAESLHNAKPDVLTAEESPHNSPRPNVERLSTVADRISSAILRSNMASASQRSPNRFEIQRGGEKIAVLLIARPAYRLGETIHTTIDFRNTTVPCFSAHISLESFESIDSRIALRSESSIYRATRRIYDSRSENTISSRRAVFAVTVPIEGTPAFRTSALNLRWQLRLGFVTRSTKNAAYVGYDSDGILEEIRNDEKGTSFVGGRGFPCESFDVTIPIKVYGATGGPNDCHGIDDCPI